MEDKLKKLEKFFDNDLKIKYILNDYPTNYGFEGAFEYVENFIKKLDEAKNLLMEMLETISSDLTLINHLEKLFDYYKQALTNCNYDPKKLVYFYQTCISNMDPALIDEINRNIVGYTLFNDYYGPFLKSKTLNEMTHVLHTYIVNSEVFYQMMPLLAQRDEPGIDEINLRGRPNEHATAIFKNITRELGCGKTDILSLSNNKIMIMIRDIGHALTIEIELEGNQAFVSYFIPKICNINMVNALKGVTPVKVNDDNSFMKYTHGSFQVPVEDLTLEVINLIGGVPQDRHMFIEGGIFANKTR